MRQITEEDVLNSYMTLVLQECQNSFKGIELEDRIVESSLALLYAIRTYKTYYGSFEEYMLLQLRELMKQKNKEAWAVKRIESRISLDAPPIATDRSLKLQDCISAIPQDETLFDVKCFIESLSSIEQRAVLLLMDNQGISAVSNQLGLSKLQIQSVVEDLRNKAAAYFLESI
ncbi:RNA polymerase subunit sigma-70 [Paenibacillus sp. A14]|uniref:RNA polymerase subunit sigma-70 n=1 Tax=Paenibacillus sp. A14 TaxID=3119820 RepID=UPI002FE16F45